MVDRSNYFFDFGVDFTSLYLLFLSFLLSVCSSISTISQWNRTDHFPLLFFSSIKSTEGRKNAYRAIVQVRPPHLNDVYLATQVHISVLITQAKLLHLCVLLTLTIVQITILSW